MLEPVASFRPRSTVGSALKPIPSMLGSVTRSISSNGLALMITVTNERETVQPRRMIHGVVCWSHYSRVQQKCLKGGRDSTYSNQDNTLPPLSTSMTPDGLGTDLSRDRYLPGEID